MLLLPFIKTMSIEALEGHSKQGSLSCDSFMDPNCVYLPELQNVQWNALVGGVRIISLAVSMIFAKYKAMFSITFFL